MKSLFNDEIKNNLKSLILKIHKISLKDRFYLQNLSKIKDSLSDYEISLYDLLVTYLLKAENVSPGSDIVFFEKLINNHVSECHPCTFSSKDLDIIIAEFADKHLHELLKNVFDLAGFSGKISIVKSTHASPIAELSKGYVFENFRLAYNAGNIDVANVVTVIIDGYIESVSELHHMLEKLAETKESMILFARGFSEEVVHTLKVNYDRKTVICLPVIVNYDLQDVNTINDIAVIAGCDIVTSLKGQLISSIDYGSLKRLDLVSISENRLTLQNVATINSVKAHIKFLQEKILTSELEATSMMLSKRIARLGHNRIVIMLPEKYFGVEYNQLSFMIDRCLRSVKACSEFGVINYKDRKYPYSSVKSGEFYCEKFLEASKEIGCILY